MAFKGTASFTLLETAIVVFLVLIFTGISFFGFGDIMRRQRLIEETYKLEGIIQKTRSEGFGSDKGKGIHFDTSPSSLIIFQDDENKNQTYQPSDTEFSSPSLLPGIEISNLYKDGSLIYSEDMDLYFLPSFQVYIDGDLSSSSTIELRSGNQTTTISINPLGVTEITLSP